MTNVNIKYRVLEVDTNQHSMVVRYYTDTITEDDLAQIKDDANRIVRGPDGKPVRCITDYNISIYETPSPSEERLLQIIKQNAPAEYFKIREDILNPEVDTSLSSAAALINTDGSLVKSTVPEAPGFVKFEDLPPELLEGTTLI